MEGVHLRGGRFEAVLEHHWHGLVNPGGQILVAKVETTLELEGLTNYLDRVDVSPFHCLVFFPSHKPHLYGRFPNQLFVIGDRSLNNLPVKVDEVLVIRPSSPEVNQIQPVTIHIIEKVGRIGVCLHEVMNEQLMECEAQNSLADLVPHFLRKLFQGVHRHPSDELRSQNIAATQLVDYLGDVVLLLPLHVVPVLLLFPCLLYVVALLHKLLPSIRDDTVHEHGGRYQPCVVDKHLDVT